MQRPSSWLWSIALLISVAAPAAATPCSIVAAPPRPLAWPAALQGFQRGRSDVADPRAPLLLQDGEGHQRVAEPPALADSFALVDHAQLVRQTARRVVVFDRERGLAAGERGRTPTALLDGGKLSVFDAVDGADGSSWIAGAQAGRIFVGQLDRRGDFTIRAVVPGARSVTRLGLARLRDGFVVVWLGWNGRGPSALSLLWLDAHGAALGVPLQLDVADEAQLMSDLALAADGDGVVVAWDPIVGRAVGELVPVELRAFRLQRDRPPTWLRKLPLHSLSWVVAGAAGGVLANDLQAVSVDGRALLSWTDYGTGKSKEAARLRAVLADGGEPLAIGDGRRGDAFLRAGAGGAVVTQIDDGPRAYTTALALDGAGCPRASGTAWAPPPAIAAAEEAPVAAPLARAECERLVARWLTLAAADPKARLQLPRVRAHRGQLVNRCQIETTRQAYECGVKAPNFAAADACDGG